MDEQKYEAMMRLLPHVAERQWQIMLESRETSDPSPFNWFSVLDTVENLAKEILKKCGDDPDNFGKLTDEDIQENADYRFSDSLSSSAEGLKAAWISGVRWARSFYEGAK